MKDLGHLTEQARNALKLPTEERIAYTLDDHWVGYSRAKEILDAIEDLMKHPPTLRMPNMLLVGASGNGKSTIIAHFRRRNPVQSRAEGGTLIPVVVMEMPSEPSESRFWTELLLALSIADRDSDPVQRKKNQALSILRYVGCRLVVIDEFHNLLFGHQRQQRHFLGVLKSLSNELKLPIVTVGTREAIRALHTDTQLSSRFEVKGLPKWRLDRDFLRLLSSFEALLPLPEPSGLTEQDMAIRLHNMCGGTIGALSRILKRSAVAAIRQDRPRIDARTLDEIEWVKLSDYREQADAL